MSYTNHTSNYNLPQYIGTDKPSYLGDFNSAMSAIDTQMKANADSASTAGSGATQANTNIGTMANLTTTDKTSLVGAVNELVTSVGTAQTTANTAQGTASSALSATGTNATAITALQNYLDLSVHNTYTGSQFTVTSGSGTPETTNEIYVARNSAGTYAKIYGALIVRNSTAGSSTTVKLNVDTGLRPDEKMTVVGTGILAGYNTTDPISNLNLIINTDGTIELSGYHSAELFSYRCFACCITVKNFGDEPQQ